MHLDAGSVPQLVTQTMCQDVVLSVKTEGQRLTDSLFDHVKTFSVMFRKHLFPEI